MKPEQQALNSILEFLAVKKVWHRRMNTGAMVSEYKGKKRFMRFGSPGMADILAIPVAQPDDSMQFPYWMVLWIEVKAPKGKQSEAQKAFQQQVEAEGHTYILAASIEDVESVLKEL